MTFLFLLSVFALALAFCALAGMAALIGARVLRGRRSEKVARCRAGILALLKGAPAPDANVRALVDRAARLGELASIILEVLTVVRGDLRLAFLTRLADADAARRLRQSLRRGGGADRVRAAEALAAFDIRDASAALRRAWSDRNSRVRFAAVRASIEIGAPPPLDFLLDRAARASGAEKSRALVLVEHLASSAPREAAQALLRNDLAPPVRVALIEGVGATRDMTCAQAIAVVALDTDVDVRAAAIGALGSLGSPQGFNAVLRALRDPAWQVRVRAAAAAGELRLALALPALQVLAQDANWWVRLRAQQALEALASMQPRAAGA